MARLWVLLIEVWWSRYTLAGKIQSKKQGSLDRSWSNDLPEWESLLVGKVKFLLFTLRDILGVLRLFSESANQVPNHLHELLKLDLYAPCFTALRDRMMQASRNRRLIDVSLYVLKLSWRYFQPDANGFAFHAIMHYTERMISQSPRLSPPIPIPVEVDGKPSTETWFLRTDSRRSADAKELQRLRLCRIDILHKLESFELYSQRYSCYVYCKRWTSIQYSKAKKRWCLVIRWLVDHSSSCLH